MSVALIRGYDNRYSLSDLWGQSFGDDPEFISAMYDSGYLRPSDIFALTDDGRLVSALFLPEYYIQVNGEDLPIRLLSCVATDSSQRGKGYMSTLIPRVLELIQQESCGVCVIPKTENLYSFYEKFGFSTAFYVSEKLYEDVAVSDAPLPPPPPPPPSSSTGNSYYDIYMQKYGVEGCVYKTKERFLQAVSEYEHPTQPCEFFKIGNGFAFIQRSSSEILVREWAGISEENLVNALISKYRLPVRIQDLPQEDNKKPIAMVYSFSDALSSLAENKGLYLNCMYN